MSDDKKEMHDNVALLEPIQKSEAAFLIEDLDKLDTKDKPYHVDKWDFSSSYVVGVNHRLDVSFTATNPEHVNAIQDAIYQAYHHYKKQNSLPLSISSVDHLKTAIQHIADALESTNWNDLDNPRKWKLFIRRLKNRKFGNGTITNINYALNKLTEVGLLSSYIDAKALRKCASEKETEQHVALPNKLYQRLMNYALETVEKYHPYRHDISQVMGQVYDIKERIHNGERLFTTGKGSGRKLSMTDVAKENRVRRAVKELHHNIPDFKVDLLAWDLADILTSCLVVVQGFSGVRIGEAVSFNNDSVDTRVVNDKDVTILTGETTKGNNGIPQIAAWQSHSVAKTALELAYDMMASTRELYRKDVDQKETEGEVLEKKIEHMRRQLRSAFLTPKASAQNSDNVSAYLNPPTNKSAF